MNDKERTAWKSFHAVSNNLLGNYKSNNYKELVSEKVKNYEDLRCNMSIKVHFLDSKIEFFPENCGDFGDEQL